ncbi:hypothetical protein RchiOBHm_Chr5g0054711 [Rosa chinensis]|uniref:Pentatricopeptide n=1 Tax=Rosa chinensis TaxID=74649 RepID=A0A2P6QG81_ROSCH|nr:hypothetical protein RchiOBHm_Chr5g0054711 [Rosa chinensis]
MLSLMILLVKLPFLPGKRYFIHLVMLEKILHQFHDFCFDKDLKNIWEAISMYHHCQLKTQLIDDAANKLISENLAFTVGGVYALRGQTECGYFLSSMLCVYAKGCGEFGVNDYSDRIPRNVNGQQVHGLIVNLGFEGDLHLNTSLLAMYAKSACMKSAEKVFAIIPEVSVVSWNVMVIGYDMIFKNKKAIEYLRRMKFWDFEQYEVTYSNLLAACIKSGIVLHDDGMMIVGDDIADGDKELTISLLWNMFVHLRLPPLVKKTTLATEI